MKDDEHADLLGWGDHLNDRPRSPEVLTLFATVSQGTGMGVSGRNRGMDELPAVLAPYSVGGCL